MESDDGSDNSSQPLAVHVLKNAFWGVDHQWDSDLFATAGAQVDIWNHNRHKHLPKSIYKATTQIREMIECERRREERRKAHSAPGSIQNKSLRTRRISKEGE
ncbi:hypothetical protein K7X08_020757 [Anisodus acutangulus]|uniref:Sof1-like protein domain-containing protein n=1 Tax=Anisodus acutangulus TaxID=402998 RepID=A0A9Q1RQJ5_9SOLA|nr:hypothetical protein K7X08_020757 [Anisodus acutangulus]